MPFYLHVHAADGKDQTFDLNKNQLVLGRDKSSDIVIEDSQLEAQHVLFAPQKDGCWVSVAKGARLQATVDGADWSQGVLAWGKTFKLGGWEMLLNEKKKSVPPAAATKVNPAILIAGVVVVAFCAYSVLSTSGSTSAPLESSAVSAPEILENAPLSCTSQGNQRAVLARESAERGFYKAQRYPFDPADGLEAIKLLRTAEACYSAIGESSIAVLMRTQRKRLEKLIEQAYTAHRLELERSLEEARFEKALEEAQALKELLTHRKEPYVEWLVTTIRSLESKLQKPD